MAVWLKALRAPFLTASIVPVAVGAAAAWHLRGTYAPLRTFLAAIAMCSLHLGANLLNDYYDHLGGSDGANRFHNPFSGGSRVIQDDLLTPRAVAVAALLFFVMGSGVGCYLALVTPGPWLFVIGALGVLLGVLYSALPVMLAGRGVGEVAIFLDFGPLPVLGTFFVITSTLSHEAALIGIPVGFLITNVILVNEFPDVEADGGSGKKTLVVRLGTRQARLLPPLVAAATYLAIYATAPPTALWALLTVPLAAWMSVKLWKLHDRPRDLVPVMGATVTLHLVTGIILALGVVLG